MDLLIAPNTVTEADADTAPTTGTPGYATDGNPATGTPRTVFPAYAFNALQQELANVINKAGLSLSRTDNTLLYQAISKLIASGAASAAIGFTPVEQGGITGLTSDKINMGNSTNGLAVYIAGQLWGLLASQAWANDLFATIASLSAETDRATTVESNLQSSKVNRYGDKMTGGLTVESYGGFTASISPSSANTGDFINYPAFYSVASGRGGQAIFQLQEHVGTTFTLLLSLQFNDGTWRYVGWGQNQRINDSQYGDVAYTSDLANYQAKGDYALSSQLPTSGTITGGTYSKTGDVLTQAFTVSVPSNGTNSHRISYPIAFSGSSTAAFNLADSGQSRSVSLAEDTTPDATGFNISVSVHGNSTAGDDGALTLTVIAQGIAA